MLSQQIVKPYQPQQPIRLVTAASLFDGHDAAINIMRRLMQASGAEVIHLGHNRSVAEIVDCAIQEDVQGIAVTSYQGGHIEFFKYMIDLLRERQAGHIRVFGGGGGTILPGEIEELHRYGVTQIYSPDDGRTMGLQGMINDLLQKCDRVDQPADWHGQSLQPANKKLIGQLISVAENDPARFASLFGIAGRSSLFGICNPERPLPRILTGSPGDPKPPSSGLQIPNSEIPNSALPNTVPILGITGTGGAGKSSLVDELVRRFLLQVPHKTVAILSVDPSKRKTGGALLGDRIRMNAIHPDLAAGRVYMRSLATRQANLALSKHVRDAIEICQTAQFNLIIVETSGIGQSDTEITEHSDVSLYVMTAEYGAATQLEKIDMLDFADAIAINKFDKRGSLDALRDVRKQYRRNHAATHPAIWETADDDLPIFGTIASQFNDGGMNALFTRLMQLIEAKTGGCFLDEIPATPPSSPTAAAIIPPDRVRYLAEIVEASDQYDRFVREQVAIARKLYQLNGVLETLKTVPGNAEMVAALTTLYQDFENRLHHDCRHRLKTWPEIKQTYRADTYQYQVRDKTVHQSLFSTSLSGLRIPKISLPAYEDWGDVLRWLLTENIPGEFPYAAGVFPLKREGEDPARMFAGEGGPERTNHRFHYVSKGLPAKRLSTAFDSVTLYGEDPDYRPDIYGKIGNSGVSICTLDDAKKLYSGFDLCNPATSVSMTINGPAPMLLGFFLNAAIDQQCERYLKEKGASWQGSEEVSYQGDLPDGNDGLGLMLLGTTGDRVLPREVYEKIKADTLRQVRGTVQADILKEDQAQNTCIFSTEFALRMMGDIQQYFTDWQVRNFYSVSISGYHIAEAGANPISQLAFTLSNGFTFVEYYLARGMHIDDFAPNLSFFFSNGMDPEYSVLGRVARRIWAKAMKFNYKANERSQKLKYHIQTSGRSLHAQEIAFNDIRTTLQALTALSDNCNSLHTNAYDEAITTPTEESVRRAMAIQLIINKEFGLAKNENPLQGAFIMEELTDLVEQAVLNEFRSLNERGGVLGAMERMYQRSKIQDESMVYEMQKHSGKLPIVGVNTFLDPNGSPTRIPQEVIRSTAEEKRYAIESRIAFQERNRDAAATALKQVQTAALSKGNIFEALMEATKVCTLGQVSRALYAVGGQYRRNM